jgi:hypothetical protein
MRYSLGTAVILACLSVTDSVYAETIFVTADGDVNQFEVQFGGDRQVAYTFFNGGDLFEKINAFSTFANDRVEFEIREDISQRTLRRRADAPMALRDMPEFHLVVCSPIIGGCIGDDVIGDIAGPAPNAEFIHFLHSLHI